LFAREGAHVLVVDRDRASAEETVARIVAEGGRACAYCADVSIEDECRAVTAAAQDALGGVDVLHNNVGIVLMDDPTELDEQDWDRVLAVNLKSMWLMAKHVLPGMRAQGSGSIVNISSIAATGGTTAVSYAASKGGVNALTKSLAVGNAKYRIRVNAIMPGLMDTPLGVEAKVRDSGRTRDEIAAERSGRVPMGFMGDGWDVARAALFLASDEARYVTGVVLPVDGGLTARHH
jgi:NAD(P)-dependent dehydrogenase (short-subunit alcohol dehydrogenase family)